MPCSLLRPVWVLLAVAGWFSTAAVLHAEVAWPRWGGPDGSNHTEETGLPLSWTDENIVWKAALRGSGQSSPVIWDDRIFLTSAVDDGRQRIVFAVDRKSGQLLWEQTAWSGEPEKSHAMNGWASASCATNGKVVVAFFGRGGLHCYSVDGKHLWSRDLGQFDGPWGTAASPIFYHDLVIQNCDSESKEASLLAVDYRTGNTVWNTPREVVRGWSTPMVIRTSQREELILNSHSGVRSYDPRTGRDLWWCKGFNGRGEPAPAYEHGLLYIVNGLAGDIYSVKPGGEGDVTADHRVWHTPRRAGRDLPSPVAIGKYLLVMSMAGIITCYDCQSGAELWKDRLPDKYASTPLVSEGKAYITSDAGETSVVEPGDRLNVVATSKIVPADGEVFRAALVPCQGQIFIRSTRNLYCIGAKGAARK